MNRLIVLALIVVALVVLPGANVQADAEDTPRATLTWKSRDDSRLYGYLVYRSTKREGPYLRINGDIVRVTVSNDEGIAGYSYVDHDVLPGKTYYYYLDTLGTDGRKRRFSGVVTKTVAAR